MIETASHEVSEEDIVSVFEASIQVHQKLEAWQKEIVAEVGKTKQTDPEQIIPEALTELFDSKFKTKLSETIFSNQAGNHIYMN